MSKDAAVRLTDTIAFIRTASVPDEHLTKRGTVADVLEARRVSGDIPNTLSAQMSHGPNDAVLDRAEVQKLRHYRRAIMLIRCALLNRDHTVVRSEVDGLADNALRTTLGSALDDVTTLLADLRRKLALLKDQPLEFLRQYALLVEGKSTSGVSPYGFCYDALDDVYIFKQLGGIGTRTFIEETVYNVHVQPFASLGRPKKQDTRGGEWVDVFGARVDGAALMITTQLTGCSVVYYLNGAVLFAAHVQPSSRGEDMCATLRADGRLTSAPGLTGVFGAQPARGTDANNYVAAHNNHCIGVRVAGTWHLYAQQRPRGFNRGQGGNIVAWQIA